MLAIDTTPALGLTQSVTPGKVITDDRSAARGYPYVAPQANGMTDDGHRVNHAIQMMDADIAALLLSNFTGIPALLLLPQR